MVVDNLQYLIEFYSIFKYIKKKKIQSYVCMYNAFILKSAL